MTPALLAPRQVFFGWRVVGAAFVFAVFAWGVAFYGPSVFLHTLHQARGWPVSLISAAITTHYLLGAGMVAYLDDAHRRFGIVATTRAGVLALAAGTVAWSLAAAPWQLFAAAALTAIGWATTSGAAINAMLMPWFKRRRGFALSLAYNGASIGGVLFLPLWVALIGRLGFPGAAATVAAAVILVLWPLAGRYLRPTPAALGLAPDGEVVAIAGNGNPAPAVVRPAVSRRDLLRQPRFITLAAAFAVGLFAQVGLIAHLVTLLVPVLGESGAAGAASLTTVCAVIGRLLLGAFIDRADRRLAAAGNFAMQACGFLLMSGASAWSVLPGCVLFGLGLGNLVSLPPLIAEAEFEAADVGRVVALVIAINQATFSFAPAIFGALHDLAGSYAAPLAVAVALQTSAAVLVLLGRRR
ncbi:MAG TPA: MFS transporter [Stellaceae bacterium]